MPDEPTVHCERCASFWCRSRGLLGRAPPPPGGALWLTPCRQVHTLGMRYAIDVVYLDDGGCIIAVQTLAPWRVGAWLAGARSVLELAAGEARRLGLRPGVTPNLIEGRVRATKRGRRP